MLETETSRVQGWLRRATGMVAILAVLMMPMVGLNPPAQATYATSGEGLYQGAIDWFDFETDGQPIPAEGAERTNTREIGDHTIATTCSIANIEGNIATYRSGNYSGDGLDNLYNIGGADGANELISGIYTADNGATVSFDFTCSVTLDGEPIDVGGLVFADAESSNASQGEYVQATTTEDVTWRVIDRFRSCDTSVIASRTGDTMRLHPDGEQCSQVNGTTGPMAVGFMEGGTSARVELKGGGSSAVAVGVVLESDFGDAPTSFGEAGALIEPAWQGGEIPEGDTNVSEDAFTLGTPTVPSPRLGATVDSDSDYLASDDALGDDTSGNPESDEDGIPPPGVIDTTWGETVTQTVECTGPGYVSGWIDWNANGTFDEGEGSNVADCTGGSVELTWTVPEDAVDSLEDEATYMRLRIAGSEAEASTPVGISANGEVEDHRVEVDVPNPGLTITKSADVESAAPGDTVDYTVTVENTGEVDYTAEDPATLTDDLSGVLDDAVYNDDAAAGAGEVSYAEPVLSWSGPLAVGESTEITYSVTVDDPVEGDFDMLNVVTGPEESNCPEGTEDPSCQAVVPIRQLQIEKTADPSDTTLPGDTVSYTVQVTNTGQAAYTAEDPATFTDDLSGVLDDAAYNDDAAADTGEVSYTEPTLSWSGALEPGQTATVTYTVSVADPATSGGDGTLDNAVVGPPESNCLDGTEEDCHVPLPVRALQIEKTSDGAQGAVPGDTVTYSVTVTNTGAVPYTADNPATFTDDLTEVLDDAAYNDDGAADIGNVDYAEPNLSWSGALEPGETATITYSVNINDPPSGDGDMLNVVVGPEESNCTDPGSTDPDCVEPDPIQELQITKTSDAEGEVLPGDTVTYTVSVENTGAVAYTPEDPATFTDDMTGVLDDAIYNEDGTADSGEVSYAEPELSWSGALEPGEVATITYSVTVNDPVSGDGLLDNAVVGPEESNCDDGTEEDCHVPDPIRALEIAKTADVESAAPGDTVTYSVTVTNTGQVAYTDDAPATLDDDLTEVLDDATYNDDAAADAGSVSYAEPVLSWSGALEPGASATITYTVTVNDPASGDGELLNTVVGPEESNCDDGTEEGCNVPVPLKALDIEKTSDVAEAAPGDTVTYSVTVTNSGQAAYTDEDPATITDDLTEVLDDATYNDDAAADAGAATYEEPVLSWSGALEPGATATITYTVTIDDPDEGDNTLTNVVTGPEESNCLDGTEEGCEIIVPVKGLHIEKVSDQDEVTPGQTVNYTVTVTNTGQVPYTEENPATVTDDLTEVLDDATYNEDAAADSGAVSYEEPNLSWTGALEPGASATITYSATVNDPTTGDGDMLNVVVGPEESNCTDPGSIDPDCIEPDPVRELAIAKTSADDGEVNPGDTVDYTITVENTGNVAYTEDAPATFTDDLTGVLDDATYNEDGTADLGGVTYAEPELSWSGALEPGEVATITYSVTVNDPVSGDGTLDNAVVGPEESNCDDGTEEDCGTVDPVKALQIAKTSDSEGEVQPGDTVEYTVTVTNSGQVDYTADDPASFTDDMSAVLDDATYAEDGTADIGEVSYTEPTLSWSGALAPGETATITYSVTVNEPLTGDGQMTNAVVGPEESNCDDGTEEDCHVPDVVKALQIAKTSDAEGEVLPGETVTYEVTVTNTGQVAYTDEDPATFTDDLTEVLDDATYNDDATTETGSVSYEAPSISWSGALEPGASATITYSVTVNDPPSGDGTLTNAVVGPEEANCDDGTEEDCHTVDPVKALEIVKSSDHAQAAEPGDVVTYSVTVTNTGQVAYTDEAPATFTDDLTEVLDDAAYNDDASADAGSVSYAEPNLSWTGALEPGASATITYSATVNDPTTGDGDMLNVVVGPEESNCTDPGSTDPDCIEPDPIRELAIAKTSEHEGEVTAGDTVSYTVTVENTGQVAYTDEAPATFTDDMTEVLDDATYNEDAAATSGEASYTEPELSWTGALAPGEVATITYSVTVNDPLSGDGTLTNAVVGPNESNCDEGTEEDCTIVDPIQELQLAKTSDAEGEVLPGDTVTYEVTVTNTGQVPYTDEAPATFTDDLGNVLDDATYNEDAAASSGEATYSEPTLSWAGALEPGESATVTYSVTALDPSDSEGDGVLDNAVVGPEESNCLDGTEEDCHVPDPVKALDIEKSSDGAQGAEPGDVVTYAVTVTNTGQVAYTEEAPASITDDLSQVLDDAAYNGDAAADSGSVSYEEPVLSWTGALEPGATATITYSVTVNDPTTGDGDMLNVVVGPEESNCTDPGSTDPDCIEPDPIRELAIA
ncbi:CshA/CshB family fibrillar adhesin-related protein, partial [Brachybacterium sp. YJGR34]|uniref:CshA/CshB family fibrillar adhesin-related protein n=1 Tax=Brachybacterium sp. YJGR34 TaxID=2059911 RepID=UPI000E0B3970